MNPVVKNFEDMFLARIVIVLELKNFVDFGFLWHELKAYPSLKTRIFNLKNIFFFWFLEFWDFQFIVLSK